MINCFFNMDKEELKTALEIMRDSIRELKVEYQALIESNKKKYLNAYNTGDEEYFNHCLGYEKALINVVQDLEELLK